MLDNLTGSMAKRSVALAWAEKREAEMRQVAMMMLAAAAMGACATAARADDAPVTLLADQIRGQGYSCTSPESATRDAAASKPNEAVWVLKCDGVGYRIRLVPDMAAKVEKLP